MNTLFTSSFTKVNRELIVELSTPPDTSITPNFILTNPNKTVADTPTWFCLARLTARGNIVLTTIPSVSASATEDYKTALATAISYLSPHLSNMRANSLWTKFILNDLSTLIGQGVITGQAVATPISHNYPNLTLAHIPR